MLEIRSPPGTKGPRSVAVFDNDGTLWPENPLPFQLLFAIDELKRLAPEHPEWTQNPELAAVLQGKLPEDHDRLKAMVLQVLAATHAGMSTDAFAERVATWMATARHPRFQRPYQDLAYQPMLELLKLLEAHGFSNFIVSGGGADFMRVWTERTYGIPPERTIGSVGDVRLDWVDDRPVLIKEAGLSFLDDKEGKPVSIHRFIGRRPLAAFGNSDGDQAMLEWTTVGRKPSFGLIVHHTDATREYAYDAHPKSSGKLVTALEDASRRGWIVVDMATDWNRIWTDPAPAAP